MLSHFSKVLIILLLTALAAFLWALLLFYSSPTLKPDEVDWTQTIRDLSLALAAFLLFATAAYVPIRRSVSVELTVGFGMNFVGVWQVLLNNLMRPDWWLPELIALYFVPLGLLLAALGLYQTGRAYRTSRLMLGSYRKIERDLATVDQLTQLYNRRYFFTTCDRLLKQAQQRGDQPVVVGFRVMNVTNLNLQLGLHAGDDVLIRVGKAVSRHLRRGDIAARMGGRRFAVFMPNANRHDAETFAEAVRRRLKHILLRDENDRETLVSAEVEFQIAVAEPGEALESLSRRAGTSFDQQEVPRDL